MDGKYDQNAAQSEMLAALRKQQQDGLFTDLTVKCGEKEHKLHKNVLCAASKWFTAACTGRFMEANSKMIELHDDNEDAIAVMIQFCYQFEYKEPTSMPMTFHVRMFTVGEKYLIPTLQTFAAAGFQRSVTAKWSIEDFTAAVRGIYEGTSDPTRSLKTAVVETSVKRSAELFGISGNVGFGKMADELPNYAMDVLRNSNGPKKRKRDEEEGPWIYKCFRIRSCDGHVVIRQRQDAGGRFYYCSHCAKGYWVNWDTPNCLDGWPIPLVK